MRSHYVLGLGPHGFHRLHYTQWGDPDNERALVCVHGLTRNGRDFDALAQALLDVYRVVCPDLPGRGLSDWLQDKTDYSYPLYLNDMAVLLARLGVSQVDWLGTSLGGLVGMMLAAQTNAPIRRLILNDVGPFIPQAALDRIGQYVAEAPHFQDLPALMSYLKAVHAPFGALSEEQWRHLALHSAKALSNGGYVLHYDPALGEVFRERATNPVDLWAMWDQIRCPVLVLRGSTSDLLLAETAAEMQARGPKAEIVEFAGVGHAPALMAPDQIAVVRKWLLEVL